jgi:hypothetical protein
VSTRFQDGRNKPDYATLPNLMRHPGARLALAFIPTFETGSGAHSRRALTHQERREWGSDPQAARTLA